MGTLLAKEIISGMRFTSSIWIETPGGNLGARRW